MSINKTVMMQAYGGFLQSQKIKELPFKPEELKGFMSVDQVKTCHEIDSLEQVRRYESIVKISPLHRALEVGGEAAFGLTLLELIMNGEGMVYNISAQLFNSAFFWQCVRPTSARTGTEDKQVKPSGKILQLINAKYGSIDTFREHFLALCECMMINGSGWCWLVYNPVTMMVDIVCLQGAGNPLRTNQGIPLLCVNLFEHAYLLDYKVDRRKFIDSFLSFVNWEFVNQQVDVVSKMVSEQGKMMAACQM